MAPDSSSNEEGRSNYLTNALGMWALGVTTVLGGQFYGFTAGFASGFGSFSIAQFLMGLAYICYVLCVAEIISIVGFSGGAFGLARAVLGFYPGFIVGMTELLEYIAFTSAAVLFMSDTICLLMKVDGRVAPVFWVLFYVSAHLAIYIGDRPLWVFVYFLTVVSLGPMLVFCFGSIAVTDFMKYAPVDTNQPNDVENWFVGGFAPGFISLMPLTTWAYAGVEAMALMMSSVEDARTKVPLGMLAACVTLFFCNMFSSITLAAVPPGILATSSEAFPMNYVLKNVFHMSTELSIAFILPAQYGMAFGFLMPYGQLLQSLANANLVPSIFQLKDQENNHRAAMIGSCFGLILCIVSFTVDAFNASINNVCILAGFLTYFAQLVGYVVIRTQYSHLTPEFVNPLGLFGAVFAMVVFAFGTVSIIAYQNDHQVAFASVVGLILALTVYYFQYVKAHQTLSAEEFKFNVLKFNRRNNRRLHRRVNSSNLRQVWRFSESVYTSIIGALTRSFASSRHSSTVLPAAKTIHVHPNESSQNIIVRSNNEEAQRPEKQLEIAVENSTHSLIGEDAAEEEVAESLDIWRLGLPPDNDMLSAKIVQALSDHSWDASQKTPTPYRLVNAVSPGSVSLNKSYHHSNSL